MTKKKNHMRGQGSIGALTLGCVLLVSGGLAAGFALAPQTEPASVQGVPGEITVPVSMTTFDDARKVTVTPQVTKGGTLDVLATGRLTHSICAPGKRVTSGKHVGSVDGKRIIALATRAPLWRDLGPGVKGADVRSLQVELARLGYDLVADGTYGRGTKAAVIDLFTKAGVAKPSGTLELASIVWLPASKVTVKTCDVAVGATLAGPAVATYAGALQSLRVPTSAVAAGDEERIVRLGDVTAPVNDKGLIDDPAFLKAVRTSEAYETWQRTDGAEAITLDYVLAEVRDVVVMPPGALFALHGARGGVAETEGTLRAVTVVASSLGQTMVTLDDGAPPPRAVRLTPQRGETTCP